MNLKINDVVVINPELKVPETLHEYNSSCATAERFGWNDSMTEAAEEGILGVVLDASISRIGSITIRAQFGEQNNRLHTFDPFDLIKIGEL